MKTISYCVRDASGCICQEGKVGATRWELDIWIKTLPQPWTAAMEPTIFTGWIYDHLKPHAVDVRVAHPLMLRAIAASSRLILGFSGDEVRSRVPIRYSIRSSTAVVRCTSYGHFSLPA
jgi:hypothetical protein